MANRQGKRAASWQPAAIGRLVDTVHRHGGPGVPWLCFSPARLRAVA